MSDTIPEKKAKITKGVEHIETSWDAAEAPRTAIEAGHKKFTGAVGALATALELLSGAKTDFELAAQTGRALSSEIDKGLGELVVAGAKEAPQPVPQVTGLLREDVEGFKTVNQSSVNCTTLVDDILGIVQDLHNKVEQAAQTTQGNLEAVTTYRDTKANAYATVYWQWHDSL